MSGRIHLKTNGASLSSYESPTKKARSGAPKPISSALVQQKLAKPALDLLPVEAWAHIFKYLPFAPSTISVSRHLCKNRIFSFDHLDFSAWTPKQINSFFSGIFTYSYFCLDAKSITGNFPKTAQLTTLLKKHLNLKSIDLEGTKFEITKAIITRFPKKLKHLSLRLCNIETALLVEQLPKFTDLLTLNISQDPKKKQSLFNSACLAAISDKVTSLQLASNAPFIEEGVQLQRFTQLTHLDISNSAADDAFLGTLPQTLTHLNISNCNAIRDYDLLKRLRNLKLLTAEDSSLIPEKIVELEAAIPGLAVVSSYLAPTQPTEWDDLEPNHI